MLLDARGYVGDCQLQPAVRGGQLQVGRALHPEFLPESLRDDQTPNPIDGDPHTIRLPIPHAGGAEKLARRADLELRFTRVPVDQRTLDRAVEVQGLLADRGQHRGVNVPDLVVAAAAEQAGLTVLHYDADFDLIATVTEQAVEWVVPPGSVD